MRIDAIIHSCGYADMLALTLPLNKSSYDSVIVYTKPGDEATKAVCAANGVECVETILFTKNGATFCRGAVYNEAFREMMEGWYNGKRPDPEWIETLDADIVKPANWRSVFEALPPDYECFYGARRYNVETEEQWAKVCADPEYLKRLTLFRGYGYSYSAIFSIHSSTFCRLWNETGGNPYPEFRDGSTADWMFRNHWGDAPWSPPTQPPDHILDHSLPEPVDPPTGLLRKLPFNVVHLGLTGVGATGRGTPVWNVPSLTHP